MPKITVPASEQPVVIARYALVVQIRGLFAECTATMTFSNPNGRALEGMLEFPLPERATVCGYALDVAGRMVEGVVVGKDQARVVLEAESRQRVDPGIVEAVRGNLFRTRVSPVPASGQRTVAVTWVQELTVHHDEAALRIALPHCRLPALSLHLAIASGSAEPQIGGFGNLILTRWRDQQVANAILSDVTPGDDLLVRLPGLPRQLIQVEDDEGERFLSLSDLPALPRLPQAPTPTRIAVAWDASAGRSPSGIARSRAFLQALLAACPRSVIDLVVFRDVPERASTCSDAASLLALIDQAPCDGGASLARLDLRRSALPHADDACWVLISDGLGSLGEGLPANGDVPVHCVVSDLDRDGSLLRLLSARTGGTAIDLLTSDAATAASAIADPQPGLLRIDAAPGLVSEVQTAFAGGRATLLARLHGSGPVQLIYGVHGREAARTSVVVAADTQVAGNVLARAWAGAHAAELGVFAEANRAELIALGQRYHLVTPGTSLIVLERLDQYLRHRIQPPASLPEMREQYLASVKNRASAWQADSNSHLEQVVVWWNQRLSWWQQERSSAGLLAELRALPPGAGVRAAAAPASRPLGAAVDAPGTPPPLAATVPPAASSPASARDGAASAAAAPALAAPAATLQARGSAGSGGRQLARTGKDEADSIADGDGSWPGARAAIAITPFEPNTPYLRAMRDAPPAQAYAVYLEERASRRGSPSFYLDCAGFFFERDAALGHRVLSNLAALHLDDPALLRILAWRLHQAGDLDLAIAVLRHVLCLRAEEPQSYRDLALALSARAEAQGRGDDLSEAMALLHRVVMRQPLEDVQLGEAADLAQSWSRFPQIEVIALEELNRLLGVAEKGRFDHPPQLPPLDARLRQALDCDLRVVMSWDADDTDIDLHLIEPSGEEAYYGHQRTVIGGLVSCDMTQGYGPEEYLLRHAGSGTYRIRCQYFGSRTQGLLGPATVSAVAITNWGRPNESRRMLTLRLEGRGDSIPVGAITIGADGALQPAGAAMPGAGAEIARAQLASLSVGLHRAEVEAKLGLPLRVESDGLTVLVYQTTGGELSRLGFGPDLLWVHEFQDGAERDLLAH